MTVWLHSHEVPRGVKATKMEKRNVGARDWWRRSGEFVFIGH